MKYCPECGNELRSGAKFCPDCGHNIEQQSKHNKENEESVEETYKLVGEKIDTTNTSNRWMKTILILLVLVVSYFLINHFNSPKEEVFTLNEITEEVAGNYAEITGMLLGTKDPIIEVEIKNGRLYGRNSNGKFGFDLQINGKYKYVGKLDLKGLITTYNVEFDPQKKRLVFTPENSPMDWYIQKIE
ncbi:MAG: zinc ribbon domain-containing protein [Saprospiraceae bacterium]|nr:zinc ribbon domain-containing protein [Saprospiraceae bacterium]